MGAVNDDTIPNGLASLGASTEVQAPLDLIGKSREAPDQNTNPALNPGSVR